MLKITRTTWPGHPTILLIGAFLCSLTLLVVTVQAEQRDYLPPKHLALVIGVSDYASWPALPSAATDARRMANLLEQGGFATMLVVNPDGQALKTAWSNFMQKASNQPESACLVYYRGHAETLIDTGGAKRGWLVPIDAPLAKPTHTEFSQRAIPIKSIVHEAASLSVRHLLLLFDASFADDGMAAIKPALRLLGPASGSPTRQAIIAGNAFEPTVDQSPFNAFLVRALTGEADVIQDGIVSGTELAAFVGNRVSRATGGAQRPQYALFGAEAQRKGDFTFDVITPTRQTARLYVEAQPASARIRLLNIKPKFTQGMDLEPGRYYLEVSAAGHQQHKAWIELDNAEEKTVSVRLAKAEAQYRNSLGMVFRYIQPGSFQMGSSQSSSFVKKDEAPHTVTLTRPFYIQANEVTVGQFRQFINASGYRSQVQGSGGCWVSTDGRRWRKQVQTDWRAIADNWPKSGSLAENLPVSCVTWKDAKAFSAWLSKADGRTYQLPTEAQWEYACRSGNTKSYAFGDCLTVEQANFGDMGQMMAICPAGTQPTRGHIVATGTLAKNAWGLHDMHGNVAEWCRDFYALYPKRDIKDPRGPTSGVEKVIRGGHYLSRMMDCRSATRSSFPPEYASSAVGFRLIALTH